MIQRHQFISAARRWIGVPWVHQGRNRLGVDCVGLLLVVCWQLRLTDYDVRGYGLIPRAEWMRAECDRLMNPIDEARPGDVILLQLARRLLHVAIRTDHGILHSWGGRSVCETRLGSSHRIAAAYAVPGVG